MEISKVLDNLYLGDIDDAEDRELLNRLSIGDILSVIDSPKCQFADINYLLIDISDTPVSHLDEYFPKCLEFIHKARTAHRPVLVHCAVGVSRSVTIVVAYLLTVTKLSWEVCLEAVQAVRPYAYPNAGFRRQLSDYQDMVARQLATTDKAKQAMQQYWNYEFRIADLHAIESLLAGHLYVT